MIFVTVGSTLAFDDLVRTMDLLAQRREAGDEVVCQIGRGSYQPVHCEYFRFAPSIDPWIEKASVVVSHGGTGSVSHLLSQGKPFVAVANRAGADDHQVEFLSRLARRVNILWTKDVGELPDLLRLAPSHSYTTRRADSLGENLGRYLLSRLEMLHP